MHHGATFPWHTSGMWTWAWLQAVLGGGQSGRFIIFARFKSNQRERERKRELDWIRAYEFRYVCMYVYMMYICMCQTESVSAYLPTYLYIIISCTPMWNIQKTLARRAISGINMQGTISDCWLLFEWPHLHTKALGACVQQVTYRIPARVPILHIYIYIYIYI
jgi:hypothetical protein